MLNAYASRSDFLADLELIEPTVEWKNQYLEMLSEWRATGEKPVPFVLKMDPSDFAGMVAKLKDYSQGIGIPNNFVPHVTYWLVDKKGNKILGVVNIRTKLNESLLRQGGHVGYGIRPGERRKGYATKILHLALAKLKAMGIEKVLVTCDKDNVGSARAIINNGGILENEVNIDGTLIQRYWIKSSS